jgi:hypothetical protein
MYLQKVKQKNFENKLGILSAIGEKVRIRNQIHNTASYLF